MGTRQRKLRTYKPKKERTMTTNKPNFIVYGEADRGSRQPQLIRIGAAWAHEKGKGFGIQIDSLPLNFNGRLVLFEPKEDDKVDGDPETGGNYGRDEEER